MNSFDLQLHAEEVYEGDFDDDDMDLYELDVCAFCGEDCSPGNDVCRLCQEEIDNEHKIAVITAYCFDCGKPLIDKDGEVCLCPVGE